LQYSQNGNVATFKFKKFVRNEKKRINDIIVKHHQYLDLSIFMIIIKTHTYAQNLIRLWR